MEAIIKEMEDFISNYDSRARELPTRIKNVINWYGVYDYYTLKDRSINKPEIDEFVSDPNLYEYFEIVGDAKRYLYENKASAEDIENVRNGVNTLSSIIKGLVVDHELAKEGDALFNLVDKVSDMSFYGTTEEMVDLFVDKKIAGVGEFLAKLQRRYRGTGPCTPFEYGNHKEFSDLETLMKSVSSEDENRNKIFASIQKWHEQPIYLDNVDDYSYSFEGSNNKTM